jgi:hypothetical protein
MNLDKLTVVKEPEFKIFTDVTGKEVEGFGRVKGRVGVRGEDEWTFNVYDSTGTKIFYQPIKKTNTYLIMECLKAIKSEYGIQF